MMDSSPTCPVPLIFPVTGASLQRSQLHAVDGHQNRFDIAEARNRDKQGIDTLNVTLVRPATIS